MGEADREVPAELSADWERATTDPDPLVALGSSQALARGIGRWQGTLVGEALRNEATWERIGAALRISRQAAWARFRHVVEERGGGSMEAEVTELKRRIHEEVGALREAMKAIDEAHRKARTEARDRLREVELQARQERQELRDRMKENIRALQDELRALRSPA
jgi:Xaa-Pro aminopeptidase